MWHLPDGRTLRVVTTPNPRRRRDLSVRRRHRAARSRAPLRRPDPRAGRDARQSDRGGRGVRQRRAAAPVQSGLRADVAAFARAAGRSGRISRRSAAWSQPLHGDHPIWQRLRATITAIDNREPVIGRIERPDGNVVDCATMPLPDGATLVTFQDVTDTVNVERALRERNEALGDGRQAQDRFRAPRLLRAALAADQHHRLRAFPRRSRHRPAHARSSANISATSRSRPTRCSRSSTTSSTSPPSTPAP